MSKRPAHRVPAESLKNALVKMFWNILNTGILCVVISADIAQSATSAPSALTYTDEAILEQVTELPGAQSDLMSNQFSGYLNITHTKALHYMYFESERDPAKDSIIFWTNGGPGGITQSFALVSNPSY